MGKDRYSVFHKNLFPVFHYSKSPKNSKKEENQKGFIQKIIQIPFLSIFIFAEKQKRIFHQLLEIAQKKSKYTILEGFFGKITGRSLFYSIFGPFWESFPFPFFIHYSFWPKSKKEDFLDFFIQSFFLGVFQSFFIQPEKKIFQKKR